MKIRGVFFLSVLSLLFSQEVAAEKREVTVQLKWWNQFQFAGYYAAVKQGYYQAEGLQVKLVPGDAQHPVMDEVLSGRADFGITGSDLLIGFASGKPVVALGAIFQHSPYVIMSMPEKKIHLPSDLVGKSIMASEHQGWVELKAVFLKEGIDLNRLSIMNHSWNNLDLIQGRIDAMTGYRSVEPFQLAELGTSPSIIRPADYGVDFYGDILFSSRSFIERNPETVEKFRRATFKGWEYAMSHKEEMIDHILTFPDVKARKVNRRALVFEANEMEQLIVPSLVDIGNMNEGRWQHILDIHKELNLIPGGTKLKGFLYEKKPSFYESVKNIGFWALAAVAFLFIAVLVYGIVVRRAVQIRTRQQREALEALSASEERYRTLVEQASDGIVICDPSFRFVQVNSAAVRLMGYGSEELYEMHLFDILQIEDGEPELRVNELTQNGSLLTERKAKRKDGSLFVAEIHSSILSNGNFLGFVRDVTRRREAEEQLEKKEQQLAAERNLLRILVDSIPDYIYVKDRETRHILNNKKMVELLGAETEAETLNKTLTMFLPEQLAEMYIQDDRAVLATGTPVINKQEPLQLASGEFRWLSTTKIPIIENGSITGVVGISRDITEQVQRQQEKELMLQVSALFSGEEEIELCLNRMLGVCCSYFHQLAGEVWLTATDQSRIYLMASYYEGEPYRKQTDKLSFGLGEGLPGTVWQKRELIFLNQLKQAPLFYRKEMAESRNYTAATAIPILYKNAVTAVLLFYDRARDLYQPLPVEPEEALLLQLAGDIQRKKSEHDLHRLFTQSPDLLCIAGQDGYLKKINPAFTDLLGYTEAEITQRPYLELVHPDDVKNTKAWLSKVFTEEGSNSFENKYRTHDGEWKWISWSSSEVLDENGFTFWYGKDITEKKELEKTLDKIYRLSKIGVWNLDLVSNKLTWSDLTREIHETGPDYEPALESAIDFYKEGVSRDTIVRAIERSMKDGSAFSEELQIITARGNEKWVRAIGEAELKDGRCVRLYGGLQDIDERKKAQLAFISTLEERNTILESIGDAFFALDKNWIITYWNKEAAKLLRMSPADVIGKNLKEHFGHLLTPNVDEYYNTVIFQNRPVHYERFSDPFQKWFEVSVYPSESGASVYMKDITERKEAQELIRMSNERYNYVTKATNDSIWDWNLLTGEVVRSGDNFRKLFGYDTAETDKDPDFWIKHVHPDDKAKVMADREKIFADPLQDYWQDEYRFLKADGAYAFVFDKGYIIRDESGRAIRMIGSISDISERKKYEDSLKQLNANLEKINNDLAVSNQELEQFAYVASHDLQEPLRMVTSFLTQLERKYNDQLDDKAHQYINFAVDGAKRMRLIILELLEFSRVGRLNVQKEPIDLNALIGEVCLLQKKSIEEKSAEIQVGPLPVIVSERAPLLQVFQNLVSNALKYSKDAVPPVISIRSEELADSWIFSVKDNGIGIDEEYFDKIFVIFQRLHGRNEYSGTGIGLAIVKKIVENLGGRIWVQSEPGKGSVFSFSIPKSPATS